ncbi:MAG: hypothetical protein C4583_04360 [Anaerolineaceae bacterium]|nr:MAG: hypothetical protein C4583_04360 [Anaerolineaceae bacterium]
MAKKRETPPPPPPQIKEHDLERGEAHEMLRKLKEPAYLVGTWAGLRQYRCLSCEFDTLDENAMFEHIEAHRLGTVNQPPADPTPSPSPNATSAFGEGDDAEVFEVELREIGSTVDEQGNEHKTFTVKE